MLPNTIEVNGCQVVTDHVEPATATFTRVEETLNRSTYVDRNTHTEAKRDQVQFYRTYPKRSGSSLGSAKSAVKFTRDFSVLNADGSGFNTLPMIVELSFSIPVGVAAADRETLRALAIGLAASYDITGIGTSIDVVPKSGAPLLTPIALLTSGTPEI